MYPDGVSLLEFKCTVYPDGRVWVPTRTAKDGKRIKGRFAKAARTTAGYLLVSTATKREYLHRLLAIAYLEKGDTHTEINHIDGNKANNHLTNLEWCSRTENMTHAIALGLKISKRGSDTGKAKLNETQVKEIKELLKQGELSQRQIAKLYDISRGPVDAINRNIGWKHVQ